MKLYGYYRSSATYRIRIVLNAKHVDWQYQPVTLTENQQLTPEFRRINPQGLVPVLVAGDAVIAQSTAIAEYLEERCKDTPLLPTNLAARAQVRAMMQTVGCDIHPLQNLRVLRHLRAEFGQDNEGIARWCRRWIGDGFAALEAQAVRHSSEGRYAHADKLSLADAWLVPQMYNARRFELNLEPYPTLRAIDEHCGTLPAFAAAHPDRQPDAPAVQ